MPRVLHLLKSPVRPQARWTIQRQSREPDTTLTVVLMPGADALALPAGVRVRRLADDSPPAGPDALTYSELLDLIFSADQVITW